MSKTDMNAMIRQAAGRPVTAEELNTVKNGLKAPSASDMNAALRRATAQPDKQTDNPKDGLTPPSQSEMNRILRQARGE